MGKSIIRRHKKCKDCNEFRDHFIYCSECEAFVCVRCAGNSFQCKEHLINKTENKIITEYYTDKYDYKRVRHGAW